MDADPVTPVAGERPVDRSNPAVYEHIAIALDGSPAALTAAAFARHLPATCYRIIHVVEPNGGAGPGSRDTYRPREVRERTLADRLRRDVLKAMGAPTPAPTIAVDIRTGDPVEELLAGSNPADILLLTTRGRGAASRALFGSVADAVSRRGVRPTLLLRPDHDLRRPERVLALLDGSPRAERTIPVARRLAVNIGCPLILVHVVDEADLSDTPLGTTDQDDGSDTGQDATNVAIDRAALYLGAHERALESPDLDVQHRVVIGETIPALIEFADPADVVVVGSRARSGLRRLVDRSVAENLVRYAPAPVLVVHDRTELTAEPGPPLALPAPSHPPDDHQGASTGTNTAG